jgi:hypothetical protein
MIASVPLLFLYGFIGSLEWALALLRTIFAIRYERERRPRQMAVVALTVMVETFVGMLVFKNFTQTGDWFIACAYSVGSAVGSLIPLVCTKRKVEVSNG